MKHHLLQNDDVNYFASLKILLWFFRWKREYQFFRIRNLTFSYESFLYFCDIYKLIFRIAPWKIAFSLNCCSFFHFQKALIVFLQRTSNLRFTTHNWGIKLIYTKPILIDDSIMAEIDNISRMLLFKFSIFCLVLLQFLYEYESVEFNTCSFYRRSKLWLQMFFEILSLSKNVYNL